MLHRAAQLVPDSGDCESTHYGQMPPPTLHADVPAEQCSRRALDRSVAERTRAMPTHDPRQLIEDVRDHLAAHDRRLAFLFGAGTSSAVNVAPAPAAGSKPIPKPLIPGVDGLTEHCRTQVCGLGAGEAAAWATLVTQCHQEGRVAHIEHILSQVRTKIDAVGPDEQLVGLTRMQLKAVERMICATIAKAASPAEAAIPVHTPHSHFADWTQKVNRSAPIEIFTTNYDILFERAFTAARVPVFDGFVGPYQPFFYPECLHDDEQLPKAQWPRLWKLHGSVNWLLEDQPEGKRIIRSHLTGNGELILPSHRKYDESRKQPYLAYMDRLIRILNSEHALLVTCGYSFRDEHINDILYSALDTRNTANIIALQFDEFDPDDDLSRSAVKRANLTVIAPDGGVISGSVGRWQLTQPVDNKTSPFMDLAFDSDALPEEKGSPAAVAADLTGKMRLGDFNWFCRFLDAMGANT